MNAIIRFATALLGLAGLGIIVHEVLKKWQLIDPHRGIIWTVVSLWMLFICREVTRSVYFRERLRLSSRLAAALTAMVNALLIILTILAVVSIPFLWFGIIEDLARGGGAPR